MGDLLGKFIADEEWYFEELRKLDRHIQVTIKKQKDE